MGNQQVFTLDRYWIKCVCICLLSLYLVNVKLNSHLYQSYKSFTVSSEKLECQITEMAISIYECPLKVTSYEKIQPRNMTVMLQHGADTSFNYGCMLGLVTSWTDDCDHGCKFLFWSFEYLAPDNYLPGLSYLIICIK